MEDGTKPGENEDDNEAAAPTVDRLLSRDCDKFFIGGACDW